MGSYVLDFAQVDRKQVARVGGKGAHLGALSRLEGVHVPPGFVVTTEAFERAVAEARAFDALLERLAKLGIDEPDALRKCSSDIRAILEAREMPPEIAAAVRGAVEALEPTAAFAVRSSATAEDLPNASFAGQQDTYLNVVGAAEVLEHVRRCWASLFTERAVTYRLRNGFDHRKVRMAVVVQRMVFPRAAGVLFTAHPVTGNRKVASIEASFGLGEVLVSGLVNPDAYDVRDSAVVAKTVGKKHVAIDAVAGGGTAQRPIPLEQQLLPALTDAEAVRLTEVGRRIEARFGQPQDIEWCLVDDDIYIVQSRPITTLFPIPAVGDAENHVYLSVGHQQMMTDAMKPLAVSIRQLTAGPPMYEAAGRLFVDVTRAVSASASRAGLLDAMGKHDPLMRDALETVLDREGFIPLQPGPGALPTALSAPTPIPTDPALGARLVERNQDSIAALQRDIRGKSGTALLEFLLTDFQELKRVLFDPESRPVYMTAIDATYWLNEKLLEWLGEKNAADVLAQSVPNNVTSEMGLALLDVADVIRPHPEVVAFLQRADREDFLDELPKHPGGREARDAIVAYLDKYGMRCVGEVDISRPRWSEQPTTLLPLLLGNVQRFSHGAGPRRFEQGRQEAERKEREVLERLRALPDGAQKAADTKQRIDQVRTFMGYREYPKYGMIRRYSIYKKALLEEAQRLVEKRVLRTREDIFFLTFPELQEVVRTGQVDENLLQERKDTFRAHQALTPPRVLTSEGDALNGSYRRTDFPAGALVGLPVSAGTVEGRARVILDIAKAEVEAGDILVTTSTDPSWTPLFVAVAGLVTEVGGLMTHGAVIAREYGLPAIVGVERATQVIRDGQRIRVHGTDGYIELLP